MAELRVFRRDIQCRKRSYNAAAQQRKQLEQEANNFSLWCDVDNLPEDHSINSERLLDELEQEDILTELLQVMHPFIVLSVSLKK